MANILLTQHCNQQCPYCFASYNSDNANISFDNFVKAVDFIKKTPNAKIGLLGGEPLLHPQFKEMCAYLCSDAQVNNVVLYTNGILLHKFLDCFSKDKFAFLININEKAFYTAHNWNLLIKNIREVCDRYSTNNVLLGVNIYKQGQNFDDLVALMRELSMKRVRISLAIPHNAHEITQKEQYEALKYDLIRLFEQLADIDAVPQFDCNKIPLCYYEKEDIDKFKTIFGKKILSTNILSSERACQPVLDIYPDLTVCRCFGYTDIRLNLLDFRNIIDIKQAFVNKVDKYCFDQYVTDKCSDCYLNVTMNCMGGCLSYRKKI